MICWISFEAYWTDDDGTTVTGKVDIVAAFAERGFRFMGFRAGGGGGDEADGVPDRFGAWARGGVNPGGMTGMVIGNPRWCAAA
jgi:hypothetical protein